MKKILSLSSYIKPYWKNAFLSIFFNLISVAFSVLTLASLAPFLGILFNMGREDKPLMSNSFFDINKILHQYMPTLMEKYGQVAILITFALLLTFFSLLRNLFAYLAQHFQAPMRAKILRDIRNSLYDKNYWKWFFFGIGRYAGRRAEVFLCSSW